MNPDTRISVHCYSGDENQVREKLGLYMHHECPVTILSPEDAPVNIDHGIVDYRQGGKRSPKIWGGSPMHTPQAGQDSIDRQRRHLEILLEYPEKYFLCNDADSVCLSPNLPEYLYNEPDILWSNLVYDPIPHQQSGYPPNFPRLAFQPPYFLSRTTIERMLAVAEGVKANPVMPYIDYYMVDLAVRAKLVWKGFPDGFSGGISDSPGVMEHTQVAVRHKGTIFIHSVKTPRYWRPLVEAHHEWRADYRPVGDLRLSANTFTTYGVRPVGSELARDPQERSLHDAPSAAAGPPPPRVPSVGAGIGRRTQILQQRHAIELARRARGFTA